MQRRWSADSLTDNSKKRGSVVRLTLNNLTLYGREKEVSALEDVYHQVEGQDAPAQVVLVSGKSGSGKTSIVVKLQEIIEYDETYYVTGKFDQQEYGRPFSALVDALTDLCDILLRALDREDYKKKILGALRDEWKTVAEVVPNLAELLGQDDPTIDSNSSDDQRAHAVIRLKTLFRLFLRSITSADHPVVMFLDDLQFSDVASLDLIESLMADKELNNFLFVSAYREEEVTDPLQKLLDHGTYKSISVGNLTVDSINALLSDVTHRSQDDTMPLAKVAYHKTHGNVFFVLQFIRLAQEDGFLFCSMVDFKWQWDIRGIECDMNVSENVVDLVVGRLQKLPDEVQGLLNVASCLGAEFDTSLLAVLYKHKDEEWERNGMSVQSPIELASEGEEQAVRDMLDSVQEQELVIDIDDGRRYKFAHDRIQQASYLLLPEGREKRLMELRVGLQLLRLYHSPMPKQVLLFVAVSSMNRSSMLLAADEEIELVRLNLEAARMAKHESAFLLSAGYLRKGIALMDETKKWKDNYQVTLAMYTLSAEMEYTGGNCAKAELMATELINGKDVHDDDKIPLYYTLVLAAGDQLKFDLALDAGVDALARLGVSLPRNPTVLHVLLHLRKSQKLAAGMTDDELLSLPAMTDEHKKTAIKFFPALFIYAWTLGAEALLPVIILKMLRTSLRYGESEITPAAYAAYGLLLSNLGNEAEAYRYGALAERMLEDKGDKYIVSKSFVLTLVHVCTNHWRKPLHLSADPLLEGYRVGMMQSGDIEFANLCAASYTSLYVHSGLPLEPFARDAEKFVGTMREYEQEMSIFFSLVPWQCALNLLRRSDDPLVLTGHAMDQQETSQHLRAVGNKAALFNIFLFQLHLAYIFCDFDLAASCARELWALHCDTYKGHFNHNAGIFFSGLAELAYARSHGAKKCPSRAMKHAKVIAKFEKEGAVNQHPMRLLLEAEAATFAAGDREKVRRKFDKAIAAASRSGYTNYAAIANERAGEYMLGCSDNYWSQLYIASALDCYRRWQAHAKVDQIEAKYDSLLAKGSRRASSRDGSSSISYRGVERFATPHIRDISDLQRNERREELKQVKQSK